MSWDFDELELLEGLTQGVSASPGWPQDRLERLDGKTTGPEMTGKSQLHTGGHPQQAQRANAEKSRRRIEAAALEGWQRVLDVQEVDVASVKKAYHELARLHHPDKAGSRADSEVFKIVHKAYIDGLAVASMREASDVKLKDGAGLAHGTTMDLGRKAWPLRSSSTKARNVLRRGSKIRRFMPVRSWSVPRWTSGSMTMMKEMRILCPTAFQRLKPAS